MAAASHSPVVSVRFPPALSDAAKKSAEAAGMNLSDWIRNLVAQELNMRCPECGQVTNNRKETG